MTKQEFVAEVARRSQLTARDAGKAVDAFLETITDTLKAGGDVAFTGFGKFQTQQLGSSLEPILVEVVARALAGAEHEVTLEVGVLDEGCCEPVAQVRRCERCAAASASRATGISFSASVEPSANDTIEPSPK